MSAIALDPVFGDFAFSGGNMQMVASNSVAEAAQELNARLNFAQGEWFMDTRQGFPYRAAVLVKNPNLATLSNLYRTVFLQTPGIASVESFTINFSGATRTLNWTAQLKHQSGNYIVGGYGIPFVVAIQGGQVTQ